MVPDLPVEYRKEFAQILIDAPKITAERNKLKYTNNELLAALEDEIKKARCHE